MTSVPKKNLLQCSSTYFELNALFGVDAADVGRGCRVLTERRGHGLTGGEDPDNGNGAVEDGLGRRWRHFR
uniref:Uncharacterized protein n=1 Tax=Oryza sativa subsp. japonica TaxID=39947 RepID=Q6EPR1_ORYSJ|nr:hypothetical protein [Oryza sativa Japonica Group]BAD29359.1 hypothetical protein [Oryza sativa Japonica Group]